MSNEDDKGAQSWLGTSLESLYRGQGPWGFATAPVTPSKFHHVLYELPVTLQQPPKPHFNSKPKHWQDDYVRMPYSPKSFFMVKQNNEEIVKPRWDVIREALSKPLKTVDDLEKAIGSYNTKLSKFAALHHFLKNVLGPEEREQFFEDLLPKIIELASNLPKIVPGSLPILKKNSSKSVSLSQLQVASLLANAFLCTFIWRKDMVEALPSVNFTRLFMADSRVTRQNSVSEKLKCVFHYFKRVTTTNPLGVITFERKFIPRSNMPRWDLSENNLGNTKIHITSSGTIEDGLGFLQVDFANKFVGGGVLGYGCVQEEIRFVICPELIISRLFTEELGDCEALIITGIERFSNYEGYAESFVWSGNANDDTPFDDFGRRRTTVAVIDATRFNKSKDQFHGSSILRELNKAFVGFSSRDKGHLSPVATGNWGCGAFKGDSRLKSLIQLMACTVANRDLVYYSFGDTALRDEFYNMHLFLANNRVSISQLWRYLCRFCVANLTQTQLYSFIQQCHFDMKSQPTLKQFLCFNAAKTKPETNVAAGASNTVGSIKDRNDNAPGSSKNSPEEPSPPKKQAERKPVVTSKDLISIIDIMDGDVVKAKESCSGVTLLSQIDRMREVVQVNSEHLSDVGSCRESTEIAMDTDEREEATKTLGFIEDKKRKISDYFSKMTNHVNTYL